MMNFYAFVHKSILFKIFNTFFATAEISTPWKKTVHAIMQKKVFYMGKARSPIDQQMNRARNPLSFFVRTELSRSVCRKTVGCCFFPRILAHFLEDVLVFLVDSAFSFKALILHI